MSFLDLSYAAHYQGYRLEAERLATMTRVLVHDTGSSHSLLAQLGIKDTIPG